MGLREFITAFCKAVSSSVADDTHAVLVDLSSTAFPSDDGEQEELSPGQPAFGAPGIVWRPRPPKDDSHAEAMALRTADGLEPFAWRDLRWHAAYPAPKEGTIALVGYGGGFHSIEDVPNPSHPTKPTSTHVIYAPYGGKAHVVTLDTTPGNESVAIVHGDGSAVLLTKDGVVLKNNTGDAYIELNASGGVLNGPWICTGSMSVGGAAALPVLLPGMAPSQFLRAV